MRDPDPSFAAQARTTALAHRDAAFNTLVANTLTAVLASAARGALRTTVPAMWNEDKERFRDALTAWGLATEFEPIPSMAGMCSATIRWD